MVFKWREDHTVMVLEMLSKEECLWNTKSPSYRNKCVRDRALESMAKRLNLQGVTPEDIKLKIKSIRTRYSSELGKVLVSTRNGADPDQVYKPKLFWFPQADVFLRSVCNPRPSVPTKDQELPTDCASDTEDIDNQDADHYIKNDGESFAEQCISSNIKIEPSRNEGVFVPEMKLSRKRTFLGEPVEMCSTTLGTKSEGISEFEAVGINVAKKLNKMEPMQAVYAESLISVILRKGLLDQLTEETDICEVGCS